MLSRVIAKNVGDVFFETQCTSSIIFTSLKSEPNVLGYTDWHFRGDREENKSGCFVL